MMNERLQSALNDLMSDVQQLLAIAPVALGAAAPPNTSGVYALLWEGRVVYVGEAKGSKGLRDRLLSKHISGDDNHAIQRAFKDSFPDREVRRRHIKQVVFARWLPIGDSKRVSAVERLLIWLLDPEWNRK